MIKLNFSNDVILYSNCRELLILLLDACSYNVKNKKRKIVIYSNALGEDLAAYDKIKEEIENNKDSMEDFEFIIRKIIRHRDSELMKEKIYTVKFDNIELVASDPSDNRTRLVKIKLKMVDDVGAAVRVYPIPVSFC